VNGIIWVVEGKENGNWVSFSFSETRAEARLTARSWKDAFDGTRIRKYARVEE